MNSTLINNEKVLDESQQKMKAFLELNEHEKAADQSLWNTTKAVLWEVYSLNSYIKKPERAQIKHAPSALEEEQFRPQVSRSKDVIRTRAKINKIEMKRIQRIDETRSWFFKDKQD